jgi:hypothetical protein
MVMTSADVRSATRDGGMMRLGGLFRAAVFYQLAPMRRGYARCCHGGAMLEIKKRK